MTREHFIDLLNRLGDLVETAGKVVVRKGKRGKEVPVKDIDVDPNTQKVRIIV